MTQDDRQRPGRAKPPGQPTLTDRARREAEERRQRQAKALRANLGRRKAQDRARADADGPGDSLSEPLENKD